MARWTFIADYRGGTYISQTKAESVRRALVLWAKSLAYIPGSMLGPSTRLKLIRAASEQNQELVRIDEIHNVWYWSPLRQRPAIVVHVIKTR
jgi:hypothetical protein